MTQLQSMGSRHHDVVIAGGGLAGLCLAIQLKRSIQDLRVLIIEKSPHLPQPATHKVGESSVEVASHYFEKVLGLEDIMSNEVKKFGLRFLFSAQENQDISQRPECGPSDFMHVPSFQIDRGQFETALRTKAKSIGIEIEIDCVAKKAIIAPEKEVNRVLLEDAAGTHEISCKWLIDTCGRASFLKKQLGLEKRSRHQVNAAWFRIDHPLDIDNWSSCSHWKARNQHSRRLSTNHLMGAGYWIWLIPLNQARTSIGIVADDRMHSFKEISTLDSAMHWMALNEPQCAREIRRVIDQVMDFKALKNYSHEVTQVFSQDRWGVAGDAGLFTDPLYSPGSDFIAMANGYLTDLISRDLKSEEIAARTTKYDQAYRLLGRTYLANYHRQYGIMGNARVMSAKIVWDFTMYWGSVALIYFNDRLCDAAFMEVAQPIMQRFNALNYRTQSLFRRWADAETDCPPTSPTFFDYTRLEFLQRLNGGLLKSCDSDQLLKRLAKNMRLAQTLQAELTEEIRRLHPGLNIIEHTTPVDRRRLTTLFESMGQATNLRTDFTA
ncbi:MAG: tryptophan 7-halogenase [Myxococcota bacterium]|nr:tryptophan 7-halogenase [Myxococcota bacterium]